MADALALGIDLGTRFTRAAAVKDGVPQVIPDAWGEPQLPSVVSILADGRILVGREARDQLLTAPRTTVARAKRLLGRPFFSDEVQKARAALPYELREGPEHSVRLVLHGRAYGPEEIEAFLVRELRARARDRLGEAPEAGVVAVPPWFNERQRAAAADALRLAGLEPLDVIEEPVAAARAYGLDDGPAVRALVFELSADECRATLVELGGGAGRVAGASQDPTWGGDDLDNRIVSSVVEACRAQQGVDLAQSPAALVRIRDAAEQAKNALADAESARLAVPAVPAADGTLHDVDLVLQRPHLERMVADLVQRGFKICDEALRTAQVTAAQVDHVILSGGPTRLPFVALALRRYFKKDPRLSVDPRLVVCVGAARHAAAAGQGRRPPNARTPRASLDESPAVERMGTDELEQHAAHRAQALMEMVRQAEALTTRQAQRMAAVEQREQRFGAMEQRLAGAEATALKLGGLVMQAGALQQSLAESVASLGEQGEQVELMQRVAQGVETRLKPLIDQAQATSDVVTDIVARAGSPQQWDEMLARMHPRLREMEDRQRAVAGQLETLAALEQRISGAARDLFLSGEERDQVEALRNFVTEAGREMQGVRAMRDQVLRDAALLRESNEVAKTAREIMEDASRRAQALEARLNASEAAAERTEDAARRVRADGELLKALSDRVAAEMGELHERHDELRDRGAQLEDARARMDQVKQAAHATAEHMASIEQMYAGLQEQHAALKQWELAREAAERSRAELAREASLADALLSRLRAAQDGLPAMAGRADELQRALDEVEERQEVLAGAVASRREIESQMEELQHRARQTEEIHTRLDRLAGLHQDVENQWQELLKRRGDIQTLSVATDGVRQQLEGLRREMEAVQDLRGKLAALPEQIRGIRTRMEEAEKRLTAMAVQKSDLAAQEQALRELVRRQEEYARLLDERSRQASQLVTELGRVGALEQALAGAAADARATQVALESQLGASQDDARTLERLVRTMEEKRVALQGAAERVDARQAMFDQVRTMAAAADQELQSVVQRLSVVQEVHDSLDVLERRREEVERAAAAARARADEVGRVVADVQEARAGVHALQHNLEDLQEAGRQWSGLRDEVGATRELLDRAAAQVEELAEQQAMVELAIEKARELKQLVDDAERAAVALRKERGLNEKIETAVKKLRKKAGPG
ncbi:MAG: Hsp70 family protein [Deltaproteobacteria bacterium]|nr:Hsp70 family protein [Deltaproteobacteria bacterium]